MNWKPLLVGAVVALIAGGALLSVPGAQAAPLLSTTRAVNNHTGPGSCPGTYTTIQAAVNAAVAGDTIRVCPGTYTEQVTIPASKNGLTLTAVGYQTAVIKAPALLSAPKAIVHVAGASGVTIQRFTITGPGSGSCDSLEYGVLVDSGGAARIQYNHITKIQDTPFGSCLNGVGVEVSQGVVGNQLTVKPALQFANSSTIKENQIDAYQQGGIIVTNCAAALVDSNDVTGVGPTSTITQNGIQISNGATAEVVNNTVKNNIHTGNNLNVATGILLIYVGGGVNVHDNVYVEKNDVGILTIFTGGGGSGPSLTHNQPTLNGLAGIGVVFTDDAQLSGNESDQNAVYGIGLYETFNVTLTSNQATDNGADGIAVASSDSDTFTDNTAHGNSTFDCHDYTSGGGTAGTANTWTNNQGVTSSPPGICTPQVNEDRVSKASTQPFRQIPKPSPGK